jgi:hypothetical protein
VPLKAVSAVLYFLPRTGSAQDGLDCSTILPEEDDVYRISIDVKIYDMLHQDADARPGTRTWNQSGIKCMVAKDTRPPKRSTKRGICARQLTLRGGGDHRKSLSHPCNSLSNEQTPEQTSRRIPSKLPPSQLAVALKLILG